ncbi:hypothetical protein ABW19_dt0205386 [Dactylella cylindrospora]|nr:hypothetical protein ABW19_dt0205386 [Dactylella cylindrospora]
MSSSNTNDNDSAGATSSQSNAPLQPGQMVLNEKQKYLKDMQYKAALGGLIAAPIIIFMPPRKLDLYTFGLCWLTVFCGNHLLKEHGHPGLLYAISPNVLSHEYEEKLMKSRKPYEGMMPSEAIWKQMTDVWNQRYDDEDQKTNKEDGMGSSVLNEIRREESKKSDSEVLRMLEEQERKRKS